MNWIQFIGLILLMGGILAYEIRSTMLISKHLRPFDNQIRLYVAIWIAGMLIFFLAK